MKNSLSFECYKKSPYRSVKHTTYFYVYDELFSQYRNKGITFVEIGVLNGGSLFMWREFFGPTARIIGVDLNPNAKKWENHGFEIFIGSQSDEDFWSDFREKIGLVDVVLDDGGHTYEQQIITTECLIDNIKDGGLLVVEDTHTSYMNDFGPRNYSFVEYTKNLIDLINQRFSGFSEKTSEDRIWSIRIYESIIAFSINRNASKLISQPIDNGGKHDFAKPYRYEDNTTLTKLNVVSKRMKILKLLPGAGYFGHKIKMYLADRKFNAKKFFR